MRTARSPRGRILLLMLFIGSYLPLVGCNDDSKTSGTMVEVSDEAKRHIQDRRETYKAKAKAKTRADKSKVSKTR
jgi:hypothetical protein